ncbi:hypothetical protein F2P81_018822 [Scophthalmus maximus]|uniref:Uncharacterized protein n=1 Tax=Scophthalmus maximus TaxID=52904 RepID=A0A6A4S971_SCOMX|nr:hypothetical protein F2P81_018822 [Scophthalmus maximus]
MREMDEMKKMGKQEEEEEEEEEEDVYFVCVSGIGPDADEYRRASRQLEVLESGDRLQGITGREDDGSYSFNDS